MIEPSENLTLLAESAHERRVEVQPGSYDLERRTHTVFTVVALDRVHRAHAALAGGSDDTPRTDARG